MNVFYLDENPKKAAQMLYGKHVVKMVLETAQLLCTAHHIVGDGNVPYKKTHMNHPSAVWCRSSIANYNWCYEHMLAIGEEYTRRYGKLHLTIEKCSKILATPPHGIIETKFTEPPQCMPDEFKSVNAVIGYRKYYEVGKAHLKDK